jgi:hypothetical protein
MKECTIKKDQPSKEIENFALLMPSSVSATSIKPSVAFVQDAVGMNE